MPDIKPKYKEWWRMFLRRLPTERPPDEVPLPQMPTALARTGQGERPMTPEEIMEAEEEKKRRKEAFKTYSPEQPVGSFVGDILSEYGVKPAVLGALPLGTTGKWLGRAAQKVPGVTEAAQAVERTVPILGKAGRAISKAMGTGEREATAGIRPPVSWREPLAKTTGLAEAPEIVKKATKLPTKATSEVASKIPVAKEIKPKVQPDQLTPVVTKLKNLLIGVAEKQPEAKRLLKVGQAKASAAARAARAGAAKKGLTGEEAHIYIKGAMKGAYGTPKRSLAESLSKAEQDVLYGHVDDYVNETELAVKTLGVKDFNREFVRVKGKDALQKVLTEDVMPEPAEVELIEDIFGFDVAKAVGDARLGFGQKAWRRAITIWNIPKSIKASIDISAPYRQGLFLSASYPKEFARAFVDQLKAFGSEKNAIEMERMLLGHDPATSALYRGRQALKKMTMLRISSLEGGVGRGEEAYVTSFGKKLAQWNPFRASERAYVTFLNKQRSDVWDNIINAEVNAGHQLKMQDLVETSRFVNRMTGRGELTTKEYAGHRLSDEVVTLLNGLFFSPRLVTSRVLLWGSLFSKSSAARKAAVLSIASTAAEVGTVLALLNAHPNIDIEMNPLSARWGQARIGNTYIDLMGGEQQIIRYFVQFVTGRAKSASGRLRPADRIGTAARFDRSKLAPTTAQLVDMVVGSNIVGEEVSTEAASLKRQTWDSLMPLAIDAFEEARQDTDLWGAIRKSWSGFVGAGVQTYETADQIIGDYRSVESQLQEKQDKMRTLFKQGKVDAVKKMIAKDPTLAVNVKNGELFVTSLQKLRSYGSRITTLNKEIEDLKLRPNVDEALKELQINNLKAIQRELATKALLIYDGLPVEQWERQIEAIQQTPAQPARPSLGQQPQPPKLPTTQQPAQEPTQPPVGLQRRIIK